MDILKAIFLACWSIINIGFKIDNFTVSIFNIMVFAFLVGSIFKLIFGVKGGNGNE